eukprot:scaffold1394_cov109-Isochrysis_galbana.AAC.20
MPLHPKERPRVPIPPRAAPRALAGRWAAAPPQLARRCPAQPLGKRGALPAAGGVCRATAGLGTGGRAPASLVRRARLLPPPNSAQRSAPAVPPRKAACTAHCTQSSAGPAVAASQPPAAAGPRAPPAAAAQSSPPHRWPPPADGRPPRARRRHRCRRRLPRAAPTARAAPRTPRRQPAALPFAAAEAPLRAPRIPPPFEPRGCSDRRGGACGHGAAGPLPILLPPRAQRCHRTRWRPRWCATRRAAEIQRQRPYAEEVRHALLARVGGARGEGESDCREVLEQVHQRLVLEHPRLLVGERTELGRAHHQCHAELVQLHAPPGARASRIARKDALDADFSHALQQCRKPRHVRQGRAARRFGRRKARRPRAAGSRRRRETMLPEQLGCQRLVGAEREGESIFLDVFIRRLGLRGLPRLGRRPRQSAHQKGSCRRLEHVSKLPHSPRERRVRTLDGLLEGFEVAVVPLRQLDKVLQLGLNRRPPAADRATQRLTELRVVADKVVKDGGVALHSPRLVPHRLAHPQPRLDLQLPRERPQQPQVRLEGAGLGAEQKLLKGVEKVGEVREPGRLVRFFHCKFCRGVGRGVRRGRPWPLGSVGLAFGMPEVRVDNQE